jgi:hypothetical protein
MPQPRLRKVVGDDASTASGDAGLSLCQPTSTDITGSRKDGDQGRGRISHRDVQPPDLVTWIGASKNWGQRSPLAQKVEHLDGADAVSPSAQARCAGQGNRILSLAPVSTLPSVDWR